MIVFCMPSFISYLIYDLYSKEFGESSVVIKHTMGMHDGMNGGFTHTPVGAKL